LRHTIEIGISKEINVNVFFFNLDLRSDEKPVSRKRKAGSPDLSPDTCIRKQHKLQLPSNTSKITIDDNNLPDAITHSLEIQSNITEDVDSEEKLTTYKMLHNNGKNRCLTVNKVSLNNTNTPPMVKVEGLQCTWLEVGYTA